jgi:hypothetical protein
MRTSKHVSEKMHKADKSSHNTPLIQHTPHTHVPANAHSYTLTDRWQLQQTSWYGAGELVIEEVQILQ